MNTIENNKLIAKFLGYKEHVNEGAIQLYIKDKVVKSIGQLDFHKDWNWLMEVVEKIEGLSKENETYSFSITKISVRVLFKGNRVIDLPIDNTKIEAVYNACVAFIKWRNENKSSK